MPGTVLLTDHVFGGLQHERVTLGEIGYTLREAPDAAEATLAGLAGGASAILVCFAHVTASVIEAAAGGGCLIITRYGRRRRHRRRGSHARGRSRDLRPRLLPRRGRRPHHGASARGLSACRLRRAGGGEGGWKVPHAGIHRLQGRRLALTGVGRIGRRVADRAQASGFEVVGCDPFVSDWSGTGIAGVETVEEAVAEADVISRHAPLTPETHHVIDEHVLSLMGRSPVLVNTSRGGLVDTDAVTGALDDGRLGADMLVQWDVEVPMDDGIAMRADVFRPPGDEPCPVILSYGPYAKGLAFQEGYADQWRIMAAGHPDVEAWSSNRYQNWEVADPEKWVPDGYACVRVDSRGAGRSPGRLDPLTPPRDEGPLRLHRVGGTRPWSNGKVGLAGISYYAINQWVVAAMQPPHLAAICPWEGAADWDRDMTYHSGIRCTFFPNWFDKQVLVVQHGLGDRGAVSPNTGEPVAGPETLSDEQLAANRAPFGDEIRAHPVEFYTDYGVALQRRFFVAFLKDDDSGWRDQPAVQLRVRRHDGFVQRGEEEWPLARTRWTRMHVDATDRTLASAPPETGSAVAYEALGDGVTFVGPPLERDLEITGPVAARLSVSSETDDADLFLVLLAFDPDGQELVFQGALDPDTPIAQGWLRASHRALDPELSEEHRPYHAHTSPQPLTSGEVCEVDVELWPTSIVLPPGYRLGLTLRGSDYRYAGPGGGARLGSFKNEMTGRGPFLHDDPDDRPPERFGGTQTLHTGGGRAAHVLLPIIPTEEHGR